VPGNTEAERFGNAVRQMFSVSREASPEGRREAEGQEP